MSEQVKTRTATQKWLLIAVISGGVIGGGVFLRYNKRETKPRLSPVVEQSANTPHSALIETVAVTSVSIAAQNRLSGQIEPYRIATVAAEIGGKRIVSRPIQQGDPVMAGATLALLDQEVALTSLKQAQAALAQAIAARHQEEAEFARVSIETLATQENAKAQLNSAKAGMDKARAFTRTQELQQALASLASAKSDEKLARIEYERYKTLVREGAAPQQTLDQKTATLENTVAHREAAEQSVSLAHEGARQEDIRTATAQVETANAAVRSASTRDTKLAVIRQQIEGLRAQERQAAASLKQAQIALEKHRVFAPFAGRILATLVENGETVAAGTPVARLGDISRVKVTFAVPESARAMLRLGQPVQLTADAVPGRTFTGKILTLGYQAETRTRTFPIEIVAENPGEALLPNMVARLVLPSQKSESRLLLPVSAIATDGTQTYVFVVKSGRLVRRNVIVGEPFGTKVEAKSGVIAGETLVADPQRQTEGTAVRIANRE